MSAPSRGSLALLDEELPPPLAAAPDPDAPIEVATLLTAEEREVLLVAPAELHCAVAVVDAEGQAVLGEAPPAHVLAVQSEGDAVEVRGDAAVLFVVREVFHDGERLALVVAGPCDDPAGRSVASYLCRLGAQLLYTALRRTLAARMHLASVQDAYCDLQLKNARLSQALQRMQELDRVKANFLATVSHELRTPLTSVIGYTEMLMEGMAGALNEQQHEYLGTVLQKSDQLLQLITGLLSISRIDAAGVRLSRAPLDLCDVLRDVGRTVAPHARRKQLQLELSLPETPLRVVADRDKLRQVVLNLVSNAIKFTPERGTVRVLVDGHEGLDGQGGDVHLQVSDSGIGVPEPLRERIFEPFFQVDSSSTREYEGTGLGLSIVRKFVEAHGGRVWLAQSGSAGSTFVVQLPRGSEIDAATPSLSSSRGAVPSGQSLPVAASGTSRAPAPPAPSGQSLSGVVRSSRSFRPPQAPLTNDREGRSGSAVVDPRAAPAVLAGGESQGRLSSGSASEGGGRVPGATSEAARPSESSS